MSKNINVPAILNKMPNSNAKGQARSLYNANKIEELLELVKTKPELAPIMRALEGNDFSGSMENVPLYARPVHRGGKRTKRTLRKKRAARKTRRHSRRA
jgi:hypothetical protein